MTTSSLMASRATHDEWAWAIEQCRAPRVRTLRQFAEQEIKLPEGPFAGLPFRCERQPHTALWLAEVHSGRYNEAVSTGPTQSGKSLLCFVLPILYHLFELRETVICGLPTIDMADEKWQVDIEPMIRASRYAALLPTQGPGSRGGGVGTGRPIRFRHGARLRFMGGGGGDKARAGPTARILSITETDGLDVIASTSREADKLAQLLGRTRAYAERRMVYKECTVSIERGHTWQRYQASTCSRIVHPCPHCGEWVSPEREHLVGWQEAESEIEAREQARFCCPACGATLTDAERRAMNADCRLLHRGQSIDAQGNLAGDPPETRCFGYRWSAFQNLFTSAAELGAEEWKGQRAADPENAEKELRQFVWCLPHVPPVLELTPLEPDAVRRRFRREAPKGLVPADAKYLTIGVDLGKRVGWFLAVAWWPDFSGLVIDYGAIEVPSDSLGEEKAIPLALRDFRDRALSGWTQDDSDRPRLPDQVFVDAGYQTPVVLATLGDLRQGFGRRFRPALGRGASQQNRVPYQQPKKTGAEVQFIGERYHFAWFPVEAIFVIEADADHWKLFVRERLAVPADKPGALLLYHGAANEHVGLSKQLLAEELVEEFIPGRGMRRRWVRRSRANHYLDCAYNAAVAAHVCGARLTLKPRRPAAGAPEPAPGRLTMPDGRPFLLTER